MRADGVAGATIGAVGAEGASIVRGAFAPVITRSVICIRARVGACLTRNHCNVPEHERGDSAHHCCLGRGVIASEGLPRQGWTRWWSVRARNWWRGAGGPSLCPWPHVFCRRKPTGRRAELRGPGEHDGAARVGLRSVRAPQRVGSRGACGRRGGAGCGSTPQQGRRKPIENRFFATSAFGRLDLETIRCLESCNVVTSQTFFPRASSGDKKEVGSVRARLSSRLIAIKKLGAA